MLKWRNVVCWIFITILPASVVADDTGAAVLRSNGDVRLNRNPAPPTSALFSDDLIETGNGAVARIEVTGSAVDVNSGTMMQFEGDELVLDHGSLSVTTSRGLKVRIGCITVVPAHSEWTRYDVSDVDGKVTVWAVKDDVNIDSQNTDSRSARRRLAKASAESERVTVRQGEQKSRDERCGVGAAKSADVSGIGAMMNSPFARVAGIVAIGVVTCWALCQSGSPVSPSSP
jgi:hypothetical protein